ncbi:Cro/CI family transcriptional regulator [Pseudomonas fragi]|nr:Cro/CI family transcriptional regulator [Pseudomonas fragi]
MSRTTLQEFARLHGQTRAASLLGLSQGSLNKALRVGRDIYVTEVESGVFTAEELRPFPSQNPARKTAA